MASIGEMDFWSDAGLSTRIQRYKKGRRLRRIAALRWFRLFRLFRLKAEATGGSRSVPRRGLLRLHEAPAPAPPETAAALAAPAFAASPAFALKHCGEASRYGAAGRQSNPHDAVELEARAARNQTAHRHVLL